MSLDEDLAAYRAKHRLAYQQQIKQTAEESSQPTRVIRRTQPLSPNLNVITPKLKTNPTVHVPKYQQGPSIVHSSYGNDTPSIYGATKVTKTTSRLPAIIPANFSQPAPSIIDDEAIARKLQEEEDARLAKELETTRAPQPAYTECLLGDNHITRTLVGSRDLPAYRSPPTPLRRQGVSEYDSSPPLSDMDEEAQLKWALKESLRDCNRH